MALSDAFDNTAPTAIALDSQLAGFSGVNNATVTAAGTSNLDISLTTAPVIDGVTITNGQSFLLTSQTTGSQNGVYTWTTGNAPTVSATSFIVGSIITASSGSSNSGKWQLTSIISSVKYFKKQPETIAV